MARESRQIYADWTDEDPGEVHIDRVGHEGDRRPLASPTMVADRYEQAADNLLAHAKLWPLMVNEYYIAPKPLNEVSVPIDPGTRGGVPGRWMANCVYDLADDEALVITTWPMLTEYQAVQLNNVWFSSFEYANAQTSLTATQSDANPDGSYTYVVCATDPGINNWLDTLGAPRGVVMFRFDGMDAPDFDPTRRPHARVVKLGELHHELPLGVRPVGVEERRAALAERRRHVQRRFGM